MNEKRKGLTLIETVIAIAVMAIVGFAIYRALLTLLNILNVSEVRVAAANLANEQLELIRNMTYDEVGLVGGVPSGFVEPFETKKKGGYDFNITTIIRSIDDPFDGTIGGAPNDLSPADYKLVEVSLTCTNCPDPQIFRFTGRAAPKNLETASTNGALFVQAIDASGVVISLATVHITNPTVSPAIDITDTTGVDGYLRIIDVPPAAQSYHVVVSKSGYSGDQTYATSTQNPNPSKIDLTVTSQNVTQSTFQIDKVSQINFSSVTNICAAIPSVAFSVTGAKLIGTTPDIPKFSQNYTTDAAGLKTASNLEWDNYTIVGTDASYDIAGTIPLSPLGLPPNATQNFKMVAEQKNPLSLLITVKDAATQLPLANTNVTLSAGSFSKAFMTGRGFLSQTDWSGGSGQMIFSNPSSYADDDGNVDVTSIPGEIDLKQITPGIYAASGYLTSSIFDTGSPSNFFDVTSQPQSQPPDTGPDSAKFQIATATTTSPQTWDFKGPDGTAATFYTVGNTNINAVHNGDQYIRYRAYLSTASTTFTPTVSDVAVTFASDCVPPGQVFFSGLASNTYDITLTKAGYQTINDVVTVNQPWQEVIYTMGP